MVHEPDDSSNSEPLRKSVSVRRLFPAKAAIAGRRAAARAQRSAGQRPLPNGIFGPHSDSDWRDVFARCAGYMASTVSLGMLCGVCLAQADGYSATQGVIGGALLGFVVGAFIVFLMRPPHVIVLAVSGAVALVVSAFAMVGIGLFAPQSAHVQLADNGAVRGVVSTMFENALATGWGPLIWYLFFALLAAAVLLTFAFFTIREVLRRQ